MALDPASSAVPRWDCLRRARDHDPASRLPWRLDGQLAGSVARVDLEALRAALPQPAAWRLDAEAVELRLPPGLARDAELAELNLRLRAAGRIRAWRDEPYAVRGTPTAAPLAIIERAASRFWGSSTLGAHATGYVADAADPAGRPQALWIARRASNKPTDPGKFDNLIGGGVPWPQSPVETLQREGWEEAGLDAGLLRQARPGRVLELRSEIPEGLQWEWLYAYDLALPAGCVPQNQDGEVESFRLLPVAEAIELAASGAMTVDAALVTLDFALRHGLLAGPEAVALQARLSALEFRD